MEFVLFSLVVLYLLPWIAAVARDHERQFLVLAVALLLGWSGIGWLAALAYALHSDPRPSLRREHPALRALDGGARVRRARAGPRLRSARPKRAAPLPRT